jgi:hypothetical protein
VRHMCVVSCVVCVSCASCADVTPQVQRAVESIRRDDRARCAECGRPPSQIPGCHVLLPQ